MCTQYIFGKWSLYPNLPLWPNAQGSVNPSGSTQELSKVVGCTLEEETDGGGFDYNSIYIYI